MSVIKHQTNSTNLACGAFDLTDLRKGAEETLRAARLEAERLVAQARVDAVQIVEVERKRAHTEGLAKGYAKGESDGLEAGARTGHEAARVEWAARFEALSTAYVKELVRWQSVREERLHEAERDLASLAVMIAEKAARTAVAVDDRAVVRQVEAAIALVSKATTLLVRCHTDDYAMLEREMPALLAVVGGNPSVRLERLDSVGRGGVMVTTPEGSVDATLATQFRRIQEAIIGDLPRAAAPDRRVTPPATEHGDAP